MSRIDWIVLQRIVSRVALTITIFFGMILLIESIDHFRYDRLAEIGGVWLEYIGMATAAAQWLIKGLPLLVLVGTVAGVLDLQSRRELTAIKSSGASMWRILRAPATAAVLFGLFVALYGDGVVTITSRNLDLGDPEATTALAPTTGTWLEQTDGKQHYVLHAEHVLPSGAAADTVQIFFLDGLSRGRIVAPSAKLVGGAWLIPQGMRYRAGEHPEVLNDYRLPTTTTPADLRLKLTASDDLTLYEIAHSLAGKVTDPTLRAALLTRFLRLLALPLLLVGALFIAFAFTAGYRRTNGYGRPILYAILTGFVVFVVTEMADRAGAAGILDPGFAACGPAFVAAVTGLTVLLYKEDGWA